MGTDASTTFMIDLHEMGQGRDQTLDRWICKSDTLPTAVCGSVPVLDNTIRMNDFISHRTT